MDRRSVSVCSAVTLILLAFAHPGAASTSRRSSLQKLATLRSLANARSTESKTRRASAREACAPCAAELARKGKARGTTKSGKIAKELPCHPRDYVDPRIARNYNAALREMKRAGITPRITSVWRSSENQAQLHRCSLSTRCRRSNPGLYRALPAGKSIHEAGFAVDMAGIATGPRGDKRLTPQGKRIVAIMKKNGFSWRYGLADPVHFEADPRKHGYRSVEEAITRTQTTCQVKLAKNKPRKTPNKVAVSQTRVRLSPASTSTKTRRHAGKGIA